jgi:hypothetical protein
MMTPKTQEMLEQILEVHARFPLGVDTLRNILDSVHRLGEIDGVMTLHNERIAQRTEEFNCKETTQ